jgi:hypothetical protein
MGAFWKRAGVALLVAGVVSTGAVALDSRPTTEFEQKLKAYDPESIAAARQYARGGQIMESMPTPPSSIVPKSIKDAQEKMKKNGLDVNI